MRMRAARAIYIAIVVLIGAAAVAFSSVRGEASPILLTVIHILLAVLTYPLGFAASLLDVLFAWLGVLTPLESLVLATPLFAALGYFQWFHLLPYVYGRKS